MKPTLLLLFVLVLGTLTDPADGTHANLLPFLQKNEDGKFEMSEFLRTFLTANNITLDVVGVVEVNSTGSLTHVLETAMSPFPMDSFAFHDEEMPVFVRVLPVSPTEAKAFLTVHIQDCSPEHVTDVVRFAFTLMAGVVKTIVVNYNLEIPGSCGAVFRQVGAATHYVVRETLEKNIVTRVDPLLPPLNLVTNYPSEDVVFRTDSKLMMRHPFHHHHTVSASTHYLETPKGFSTLDASSQAEVQNLVSKIEADFALPRHTPWLNESHLFVDKVDRLIEAWYRLASHTDKMKGKFEYFI